MLAYFLMLLIPFAMYFVCIIKRENGKKALAVGLGDKNDKTNLAMPTFFLFLLAMLMFRGESVGSDTGNYRSIFEESAFFDLKTIFQSWEEFLFSLFNFGMNKISGSYRVYLIITSIIELVPIMWFYCKDKSHTVLKIALFINMSTFIMMFSGIRQAMAIAVGVIAFDAVRKNKKIRFIILSVIAFCIHTSGFMVFLLYPLYHIRFKKKHLLFIIPAAVTLLVFNQPVFSFLTNILANYSNKFEVETSTTGAFGSLFLFVLLAGFSYFIADEKEMDAEAFALRNVLVFAVFLQCFAPLHTLAMRMNYYFIIFIPLALSKCLSAPRKEYANVAKWGERIIIGFFLLYFCYGIIMAYLSGGGALNTVPYVAFWAEQGM